MTVTVTSASYMTGAKVARPAGINKNLMPGAEVPDWLEALCKFRKDDPHFSNTGTEGARLKSDFDGARQNLGRHFQEAATSLPLTEDDIAKAWEKLRAQGSDVTGQARFKPFAESLVATAKPRVDGLRSELIRIAKRGPEAIHHETMAPLLSTAGDSANEILRQRRELHFKTCNEHFGEILGTMTPQELTRVDAVQLERMAHDHYQYLTSLGTSAEDILKGNKAVVVDALKTGTYPDATRRNQIMTEIGSIAPPAITDPPIGGKKPRTDGQREGDRKRAETRQKKLEEELAAKKRLQELEEENARLRDGILTEHPANPGAGEPHTITLEAPPAHDVLHPPSDLVVTPTHDVPHNPSGLSVTSDTVLPLGELPHPANGVPGMPEHAPGSGRLTSHSEIFVSGRGIPPRAIFERNFAFDSLGNGYRPYDHRLLPLEPHTPLPYGSDFSHSEFVLNAGGHPLSVTTKDFDPRHVHHMPPTMDLHPPSTLFDLPPFPPIEALPDSSLLPPVELPPPLPPVASVDHSVHVDSSLPPPVELPPPLPPVEPPVVRVEPPPASTLAEHVAPGAENALVQGERLLTQEGKILGQKEAQLAAKGENLFAKVVSSIEKNPGLAGAAAAVAALGAYHYASKSKAQQPYTERLAKERNATPQHKTEAFKPDADVQVGAAIPAKELAKTDPTLQTSR